jgi:hypothetical protein
MSGPTHSVRRGRAVGMLAVVCALAALCGSPQGVPRVAAAAPHAALIVSRDSGIDSIPIALVRRCFLGSPVDLNGVRLVPFNHPPESGLRVRFDDEVLGMTTLATQRYWIDSRIRGGARPPRAIGDAELLAKVVEKLRGAIGYANTDVLSRHPELRAIAIDGVRPEDPRYPLY